MMDAARNTADTAPTTPDGAGGRIAHMNGVGLYYELTGDADTSLVLVHGSWGDHHNWDRVVPALATTFRVLTFDRRGHSLSERPPGQGSVREDVADLAALIEHLGLAPAHLAGNSFGASIVLRLAAERPALVRSLVAHEPPLFGLLEGDPEARALLAELRPREEAVVELLASGDLSSGARQFVDTIAFGPGSWDQLPSPLRRTFVANAPTWMDERREPAAYALDLAALASYRRPALLTQGDQSPPFFAPIVAKVAAALPAAEVRTIPGAGHVPHLSHPQEYVELVATFATRAADQAVATLKQ